MAVLGEQIVLMFIMNQALLEFMREIGVDRLFILLTSLQKHKPLVEEVEETSKDSSKERANEVGLEVVREIVFSIVQV